jgi:hypothetical protein
MTRVTGTASAVQLICIQLFIDMMWSLIIGSGRLQLRYLRGLRAMYSVLDINVIRPMAQQPPSGPGPAHWRAFTITPDTPQSAGLLWRSDQPFAETSALQHTTFAEDRPIHAGI